jgi:hypothetical protein
MDTIWTPDHYDLTLLLGPLDSILINKYPYIGKEKGKGGNEVCEMSYKESPQSPISVKRILS